MWAMISMDSAKLRPQTFKSESGLVTKQKIADETFKRGVTGGRLVLREGY